MRPNIDIPRTLHARVVDFAEENLCDGETPDSDEKTEAYETILKTGLEEVSDA